MSDRELTVQELAKIEVDTEIARQDLINKRQEAELKKLEADAKVRKTEAEILIQQEALRQARYATSQMERAEKELLADDKYNHTFYFNTPVGESSVRSCMQRLSYWDRLDPKCSMEIVFNSPGGSVIDGLALFDYIQELKRGGHSITTKTRGMAASMAGILLQAGTERVMAKEAWMLIHEVSTMAIGKIGEIEDEVKFVKRIQDRVLKIFADGCAEAHKRDPKVHPKPFTVSQLRKNWARKDWWIDSDEALEHGLVDRVA